MHDLIQVYVHGWSYQQQVKCDRLCIPAKTLAACDVTSGNHLTVSSFRSEKVNIQLNYNWKSNFNYN